MDELHARQRALTEAIVSGRIPSEEPRLRSHGHLSGAARLGIYVGMYRVRTEESLREDFPRLSNLLGSEAFCSLIRTYLLRYPSRSWTLEHLGRRLPRFLGSIASNEGPDWMRGHPPAMLRALARLELTRRAVLTARRDRPLGADLIAACAGSASTVFRPARNAALLRVDWPVHRAQTNEDLAGLQPGVVQLLVRRAGGRAEVQELRAPLWSLARDLRGGTPLGTAIARASLEGQLEEQSSWIFEVFRFLGAAQIFRGLDVP